MPRDSNGLYSLPVGNPVVSGTIIESIWANSTMQDIAVQLNNVLTRDGTLGPIEEFLVLDGTIASPGLAFAAQPGTGLWRDSTKAGYSYQGQSVWDTNAALTNFYKDAAFAENVTIAKTLVGVGAATFPSITIGPATDVNSAALLYKRAGVGVGSLAQGSGTGFGVTGPDGIPKIYVSPTNIGVLAAGTHFGNICGVVGPVTGDRAIGFYTGTLGSTASMRFYMGVNSAPETGSNAGSNFYIARSNDAGAFLGTAFYIDRATGQVVIGVGSAAAGYTLTVAGSITSSGNIYSAGQTIAKAGSAGSPGLAFDNSLNTGIYSAAGGRLNFAFAGALGIFMGTAGSSGLDLNITQITNPMLELHKPGNAAYAWVIDSSNNCALVSTSGSGVISATVLAGNTNGWSIAPLTNNFGTAGTASSQTSFYSDNSVGAYALLRHVAGGVEKGAFYLQTQSDNASDAWFITTASARRSLMVIASDAGANFYSNYVARPGGGTFQDNSDIRLKKNVQPWGYGMAAIRALPPTIEYEFIDEFEGVAGKRFMGFSADDVEPTPLGSCMVSVRESVHTGRSEFYDKSYEQDETEPIPEALLTRDSEGHIVGPTLRTVKRTKVQRQSRPIYKTLPGGVKTLDTTPMLYAMLNALKELDQRLTAGGL